MTMTPALVSDPCQDQPVDSRVVAQAWEMGIDWGVLVLVLAWEEAVLLVVDGFEMVVVGLDGKMVGKRYDTSEQC